MLRRLSVIGEMDEVFRLRFPTGSYLSMDRCLFLTRRGLGLRARLRFLDSLLVLLLVRLLYLTGLR